MLDAKLLLEQLDEFYGAISVQSEEDIKSELRNPDGDIKSAKYQMGIADGVNHYHRAMLAIITDLRED